MVKVILGNNFGATKTVIVPSSTSVHSILVENNINTNGKLVYIGSTAVIDHSQTLADLGVTEECMLTCATKADGGKL